MNILLSRTLVTFITLVVLMTSAAVPLEQAYAVGKYLPQEKKEEMKPADQTEEEEPEDDESYNLEEIAKSNKDAAAYIQLHEDYAHKATLTFFIGSFLFMGASYYALRNRNTGVLLGAGGFYAGSLILFSYYLTQSRSNLKKASEIYRFDLRSKEQGMTSSEVENVSSNSQVAFGLQAHPETRAISAGLTFVF